jgi:hypothetical protein
MDQTGKDAGRQRMTDGALASLKFHVNEVVDPEVSFVVSALIQMQFTPAAVHW